MPHGLVLLRFLLTICATYLVLTHSVPAASPVPMALFLLGAATVTAALLTVPAGHLASPWLVSSVVIVDAAGFAGLAVSNQALPPDLLLLFLLAMLMAAITTSRRQMLLGVGMVVALHFIGSSGTDGAAAGRLGTFARLAFLCAACAFYCRLIGGMPGRGPAQAAERTSSPRRRESARPRPLGANRPQLLNPRVAVLGLCRRYWDAV